MKTIEDKFESIIPEIFEKPTLEFNEHLQIDGNKRIIFSARYGVGKSTFIEYFFNEDNQINRQLKTHKNAKKLFYKVVHLSPVNYSVATNEDIFQYIKYDILYDLIEKHSIVFEQRIKPELWIKAAMFINQYGDEAISSLLAMYSKVTPDPNMQKVLGIVESLRLLSKKLTIPRSKLLSDEEMKISNFLKTINQRDGSLYEQNGITQIISAFIENLKEDDSVKTVLVIDDLDRLDPHHIFRIFNVFAAHFDRKSLSDKFNFDHIVFVCDIRNVKSIFSHAYGTSVDFNGYINKFYSSKVYHYDNIGLLKSYVNKILKTYILTTRGVGPDVEKLLLNNLEVILSDFLTKGFTTLRSIMKFYKKNISLITKNVKTLNYDVVLKNTTIPCAIELDILTKVVGDKDDLFKYFDELIINQPDITNPFENIIYINMLKSTIPLLYSNTPNSQNKYVFLYDLGIRLDEMYNSSTGKKNYQVVNVNSVGERPTKQFEFEPIPYYFLYKVALEHLIKQEIIV